MGTPQVRTPLIPKEGQLLSPPAVNLLYWVCVDLQEARDTSGSFCAVAEVAYFSACKKFMSVLTLIEAAWWLLGGISRKPPDSYISHTWWNTDKSLWQVSKTVRPAEPWCHASREALITSLVLLSKSPQTEICCLSSFVRLLELTLPIYDCHLYSD